MDVRGLARGINLVELVVVVVIFGLLAALAIPRLSSGATSDAPQALRHDLAVLRSAIELYHLDHGFYPGQRGDGEGEAEEGSEAVFVAQLTRCSDASGGTAENRDAAFCFGPYLRDGIPGCPVEPHLGRTNVHVVRKDVVPGFDASVQAGWVYNCDTGDVAVNSDAQDLRGASYDTY